MATTVTDDSYSTPLHTDLIVGQDQGFQQQGSSASVSVAGWAGSLNVGTPTAFIEQGTAGSVIPQGIAGTLTNGFIVGGAVSDRAEVTVTGNAGFISGDPAADADYAYRISGSKVVGHHNFAADSEVDQHRDVSQLSDPQDLLRPGTVFRQTSDFESGGGCLEVFRAQGTQEAAAWWRSLAPLQAPGNGKAADDPAASGTITVRPWNPVQGTAYKDSWPFQVGYGPDSSVNGPNAPSATDGAWISNHIWIQIGIKVDPRRLNNGFNGGKNFWITGLKNSAPAQEILVYYPPEIPPSFRLYHEQGKGIPNQRPEIEIDWEEGWHKYLFHFVFGDEVDPSQTNDSNPNNLDTKINVWWQDYVGGKVGYTKIFEKNNLGLDYQNNIGDGKALFGVILSCFHNGLFVSTDFWTRYDEMVWGLAPIPPKSTFSGSSLETAAAALSPGGWSLDPITWNASNSEFDISWQNTNTAHWDKFRREFHYSGKAQNGGSAKHYIWDEQTETFRATSLNIAPGKLGHMWGCSFDSFKGDYYYIEQDAQPNHTETIRYMDRSVEAGQGTTNSPWTQLPDAGFELIDSNNQVYPHYHPNLMGPGRPGLYVGASFRPAYFDITNQTWAEVSAPAGFARDPGFYIPGRDIVIAGHATIANQACIIRAGEYDDTTPDQFTTPIRIDTQGLSDFGKIVVHPNDDSVILLLQAKGNNVWSSVNDGQTWVDETATSGMTHPFWDNFTHRHPTDAGGWTAFEIERYGVIMALGSHNGGGSMLWKPEDI